MASPTLRSAQGAQQLRCWARGLRQLVSSCKGLPDFESVRSLSKKEKGCETPTGHFEHIVKTLMKDARRGLNCSVLINAMGCKAVLGEIAANRHNAHELPLSWL